MSFPYNPIITGTYTSDGTSQLVDIPADVVKFELFNLTYFGSTAATTVEETAWWVLGLADDSAYIGNKTNGAATIAITSMATSGGFTLLDRSGNPVGNQVAVTGITNADPMVVSTGTTTGLVAGDTVRLYADTTAPSTANQIYNRDYTIDTVVASTSFSLPYTGVAPGAAETGGAFYRKVNINSPFYPRNRLISNISKAASAVIEMTVTHGFTVGQLVRIYCPASWGMSEINGQLATITAISTTNNTITVNINSSAYTTFAYPSNAVASAGIDQPQVVPVGEAATSPYQNLLDDATDNVSQVQMSLGSGVVGAASDLMRWIAYRGASI
jgi:hypothetical protein